VTTATGAAGTTLGVGIGEGARFPAAPFNATVWPFDMAPDPTTAEVVRVTARTGDSLTITRAQEGTTARAIIVGDFVAATITAKSLTDIESGVNFPLITTAGQVTSVAPGTAVQFATIGNANHNLYLGVEPPANNAFASGPNAAFVSSLASPGLTIQASHAAGAIRFQAGSNAVRGTMHPSGGFSWGGTTDPGAGSLSVSGHVVLTATNGLVHPDTNDGADSKILQLCGGGDATGSRGAFINLGGNESANPGGALDIVAGNTATGKITFYTGPVTARGTIHASGGFSWGGTTDPGAGAFAVGNYAGGNLYTRTTPGEILISQTLANADVCTFYTPSGQAGGIAVNGTTTTYRTTSDARLKTPLSRHSDTDVLRDTVIHDFLWKSDGSRGRGVFAQEAYKVAPFAVSVGSDEVDDEGRLTHPWGVDYSKYVPDLITGWQQHERELIDHEEMLRHLMAENVALMQRVVALVAARPSLMQRIRAACAVWFPAWITP